MIPKLPRISKIPKAFEPFATEFNAAMVQLEGILNFTSNDQTLTINQADGNTDMSAGSGLSGGSLPPGYTFEEFTICDSGTPATRWWPTWPTNPEA